MKKHITILLIFIFISSISQVVAQEISNPELAKELISTRKSDRKLRMKWAKLAGSNKRDTKKFKELTKKINSKDSINTIRLKQIIAQYGWPNYDLVGKKGSTGAWIIVQHADGNPIFQMETLPLLKKEADLGQIDPVHYAFLYDRVQVALGKKQLYATQSTTNNGISDGTFQPIEDEANVQNRRAEMGFDLHIETYAENLGFEYKIPSIVEAKSISNALIKTYKLSIEKANEAMFNEEYKAAISHFNVALRSSGSIMPKDYVAVARAYSLSKSEQSAQAYDFLIKAVLNGFENYEEITSNLDFQYLKETSKQDWENVMRTIYELKSKK